jgi:thiamine-phosphate pyrophosphorylase
MPAMKNPAEEPARCRLYLITPPAFDPPAFRESLSRALDGGDVACVQLRVKDVGDDAIRRACDLLRPVAQDRAVAFILNDRPDLAAATGCDGVHVGQQDARYEEARRLLGPDRIVGVTAHDSRHLAMEAAEAGADYVAFGASFPTSTKDAIGHPAPEILEWWSQIMTVPCVAIGGITPDNCAPLVKAGADFLAVVGAVWNHPDGPAEAVKLFNRRIAAALSP